MPRKNPPVSILLHELRKKRIAAVPGSSLKVSRILEYVIFHMQDNPVFSAEGADILFLFFRLWAVMIIDMRRRDRNALTHAPVQQCHRIGTR